MFWNVNRISSAHIPNCRRATGRLHEMLSQSWGIRINATEVNVDLVAQLKKNPNKSRLSAFRERFAINLHNMISKLPSYIETLAHKSSNLYP